MIAAFFVIIFGACVGSFLSAILHRTRTGESFCRGRSKCPKCSHVLGVADLVPVLSWIFCRGKCRYCKAKVSWEYLGLEVGMAFCFLAAYYFRFPDLSFPLNSAAWLGLLVIFALLSLFALIFVYDARHGEVPDAFSLTALGVGLVGNIFLNPAGSWKFLLAAALGAGFFGAQYLASRGKWIGSGDILIGAAIGAAVGLWGLAAALFIAYTLGLAVTIVLLVSKKKTLESAIPLGPFLATGTAAVLILNLGARFFGFYA
jgi:prepilin signal peptidase PulO-like enzyme (type II secretory pathway)